MAARFPPAARLRSAADFRSLQGAPGRIESRLFRVRYATGSATSARLGLAVSRKVSKRAVVRNRIKRVVRDSFRHHRDKLPVIDLLVIAKAAAADAERAQLRRELESLWPRIKPLPTTAPGSVPAPR